MKGVKSMLGLYLVSLMEFVHMSFTRQQILLVVRKHGIFFKSPMKVRPLLKFLNCKCLLLSLRILGCMKTITFFFYELSDIINSSFNLGEPVLGSKVVRKISRSLLERFKPKVIAIEESKDIDSMRVDKLVGSIQTYEMTYLILKGLKTLCL